MTDADSRGNLYLKETETASRQLFTALEHYRQLLNNINPPFLIRDVYPNDDRKAIFDQWHKQNEDEINKSHERAKQYIAQWFSESTIAGAILQIAYMGIRLHLPTQPIPDDFSSIIETANHEAAHFCIGRRIREVPQGLIIYAGRIQYNHLNDDELRSIPMSIFERLAKNHGWPVKDLIDPAFDLNRPDLQNYSANILHVMEWNSYVQYEADMSKLLGGLKAG